jgi:hypothetical protein
MGRDPATQAHFVSLSGYSAEYGRKRRKMQEHFSNLRVDKRWGRRDAPPERFARAFRQRKISLGDSLA